MKKLVIVVVTLVMALSLLVVNAGAVLACDPAGLTPGYWKNHEDSWDGVSTEMDICALFDVPEYFEPAFCGLTLMDAVQGFPDAKIKGKKSDVEKDTQMAQILLRAAVAAYLNAWNIDEMGDDKGLDIAYPMGCGQIVEATNLALRGDEIHIPETASEPFDEIYINEPVLRDHMEALKDIFDGYNNLEMP